MKMIYFLFISIAILYVLYRIITKPQVKTIKKPAKKYTNTHVLKNYNIDDGRSSLDGVCLYDTKPESMVLNAYPIDYPADGGHQFKHNIGDNFKKLYDMFGRGLAWFHGDVIIL